MAEIKSFITHHLVKSEDLNHHGTLFAGHSAEWFIESGFVAASSYVKPQNLICLKIHGMEFLKAVKLGEILCFDSRVIYAGRSSLITYTKVTKAGDLKMVEDGYISFIHVDENTKPMPHGVTIKPETEDDIKCYEEAKLLKK